MIDAWALARSFGWGILTLAYATPTNAAPTRNRANSVNRIRFAEKNRRQVLGLNSRALRCANSSVGWGVGSSTGMPGSDGVLKFLPSSAKAQYAQGGTTV